MLTAGEVVLPKPGTMVDLSAAFHPPVLKGIKVHPENPFRFDFILDKGDSKASGDQIKWESNKLIKYFLASLTVPEKDLWVNLSPYEKDRIVPEAFGQTEMGRDLLAEDYLLKQITASLIYPEGETGKRFWKRVYAEAAAKFGTKSIPVNTFNKVWIVPEKAVVFENTKAGAAYVTESRLKVMLEEDYLSLTKHHAIENQSAQGHQLGSQIIREIVIPLLTKEVNTGRNFSQLRQVYHSLILAAWYKRKIRESLLSHVYSDRSKVAGLRYASKDDIDHLYQRYLQAFKKGAYNYIKDETDPGTKRVTPRKYFSGGVQLQFDADRAMTVTQNPDGINWSSLSSALSVRLDAAMPAAEGGGLDVMSPQTVRNAAQTLSVQDANVVLEESRLSGKWIFRRGPVDLKIDPRVTETLGNLLAGNGHRGLLLALRGTEAGKLEKILHDLVATTIHPVDVQAILSEQGIKSAYAFKRVLLVPPYGDMEGRPLRYKVPSKGVEIIAHRILRETEDADAIVYNPNLGSPEELYKLVQENHFDVIGVSILQSVLPENLKILGRLAQLSPRSFFMAGGAELRKFPMNKVFESWPVDVLSLDVAGSSFIESVKTMRLGVTKQETRKALASIDNLAILDDATSGKFVQTRRRSPAAMPIVTDTDAEVPLLGPNLVHSAHYDAPVQEEHLPIAHDRIGRRPTRVLYGNFCKGKCIFCGTTLNSRRDIPIETVMQVIKMGQGAGDDSVHFESADILNDGEQSDRLAESLMAIPEIRRIPKLAIARVDEIKDGEILKKMGQAGFKIIAYGIESFNDEVLKGIGKETTREQNIRALNMTLDAGIKPGINLIMFSPWDTVATTLGTIRDSLYFMERGAYINVVPYLFAGYGRRMSRMPELLDNEVYDYPGLRKPFEFPRLAKNFDPHMQVLRNKVQLKFEDLKQHSNYPAWAQRSVTIDSLLMFKSFVLLLLEERDSGKRELGELVDKIDSAIERTMRAEASTMKTFEDKDAPGALETWFDPFNHLLARAVLQTEDGRKVTLMNTDSYPALLPGHDLPSSMAFDIFVQQDGHEVYKGFVSLTSFDNDTLGSFSIRFRSYKDLDVFIHRAVTNFIEDVTADSKLLVDHTIDFEKDGTRLVPRFHRSPDQPFYTQAVGEPGALDQAMVTSAAQLVSVPSTLLSFKLEDYPDWDTPSAEAASFDIDGYLKTKFPSQMLDVLRGKQADIEIHRGSAGASGNYVKNLVAQGYDVVELPGSAAFPPHQRFFQVRKGEAITYLITGLIGSGRELFMVQALAGYFGYPREKIHIRVFDEGGYGEILGHSLGKYAGKIHKAVILHQVEDYFREVTKSGSIPLTMVERIKGDYVDALVAQAGDGMVLFFDTQFAYGSHAENVVDYLVTPVEQGGLGITDLTLHGAAGGVGQGVKVNDLVAYKDVSWKGEDLRSDALKNDVDAVRLVSLLPGGVTLRELPVHSIPSVLSGSVALMDKIERQGGGVVELEMVPVMKALNRHPGVKFRAFYEIHDKPATTSRPLDTEAIGKHIAGLADMDKRHATWRALAGYLFASRDVQVVLSLLSRQKNNAIFLGQGGTANLDNLKRQTLSQIQDPSLAGRIKFIDNIDEVLRDPQEREMLWAQQAAGNLFIVGQMSAKAYTDVEASFFQNGTFDHDAFGRLNFEVSAEGIPGMRQKKVVVLGATGFVGRQVLRHFKEEGFTNVLGVSKSGSPQEGIMAVDLTDQYQLRRVIEDADIVVNSAVNLDFPAMQAGTEETKAVNVQIPQLVASMGFKGQFVQLSTYYVFGDNDNRVPAKGEPAPASGYGRQKLDAERAVAQIPNHAIIRLGPMFGLDMTGRQKGFYRKIVEQLEGKRTGESVTKISAATYPISSLVYIKDVAKGIVGLVKNGLPSISQISGDRPLDAVEQAELIAAVYNRKFGTNFTPDLDVVQKSRGGLTPDAHMYSVTTPDLEKGISDFIDEVLADSAMTTRRGGIDLGGANIEIRNTGGAILFHADSAMLQRLQSVPGFSPVIINIQPKIDLRRFLGLSDTKSQPQLAKV